MCKVANKYIVAADGDLPGYSDIQNARAVAAQKHDSSGLPQIIYMAVEVTFLPQSSITFKPVDGVNEK